MPFLDAYSKALGNNEYYEQVLRVITMLDDSEIKAKRLNGQLWYEIDDVQDLDIATSMFTPDDDEKVALVQKRYGGYWRYPNLLDFCYLVNPYFPPQKLIDEIKASFEKLISQYPSGMEVNSLLAGKNFNIHSENIVVGNGAAELIKVLMARLDGKTGFIRPTFEEYPNRYDKEKEVVFVPNNGDFSYTEKNIEEFFDDKEISNLIVINPDNPTGNYISRKDLLKLIAWTKNKEIKLIIDESFVDFADEKNATLINQNIINDNAHLFIMKSISKSYGVPGIRLGVLASGNIDMINKLKKDVSIWNINSFGEFYMQIYEKYKKDYAVALELIKAERNRFQNKLEKIKGIRVIPSQANYIMIEITNGMTSEQFTKVMLLKYNCFVKDLSKKTNGRQYIRLAVRNLEEDDKLIEAISKEIGE